MVRKVGGWCHKIFGGGWQNFGSEVLLHVMRDDESAKGNLFTP